MDFLHVRLQAPERLLPTLADFYAARLGVELLEHTDELVAVKVGVTRLDFVPSEGQAFYHFALLAPGNRFDALLAWTAERIELLPERATGEVVFDFSNWDALACYFYDPAGNIVELIAHRGIGETKAGGSFAGKELLGFSELGVVGEPAAIARLLRDRLELELWDGTVHGENRLGFVGERAKTLIVCPPDRPWLPTDRPAEGHAVDVVLSGPPDGEALIGESGHRIRRGSRPSLPR
jgi:hypothetical protein